MTRLSPPKDEAESMAQTVVMGWIARERHYLDGGIHWKARDALIADVAKMLRGANPPPPLPAKRSVKKAA